MTYHEKRSYDPVEEYTEAELDPQLLLLEGEMQRFKLHLTKDGVHHDEQANGCKSNGDLSQRNDRYIDDSQLREIEVETYQLGPLNRHIEDIRQ